MQQRQEIEFKEFKVLLQNKKIGIISKSLKLNINLFYTWSFCKTKGNEFKSINNYNFYYSSFLIKTFGLEYVLIPSSSCNRRFSIWARFSLTLRVSELTGSLLRSLSRDWWVDLNSWSWFSLSSSPGYRGNIFYRDYFRNFTVKPIELWKRKTTFNFLFVYLMLF